MKVTSQCGRMTSQCGRMTFLCLVAALLGMSNGLVLHRVWVPPYGLAGGSAELDCDYDGEGQQIYSVKWYKGGREFYRFLPGMGDSATVYPRPGVQVDVAASDQRRVALRNLSLASTGRYRCEVSSEAPMFATDSGYGDLLVVVVPLDGPVIEGGKDEYKIGDIINLNCSSHQSKPAADLAWFINGHRVEDNHTEARDIVTDPSTGLHTSSLGLHLTLKEDHWDSGRISVTCTASIDSLAWAANQTKPVGSSRKREHFSVNQVQFLVSSLSSSSLLCCSSPHWIQIFSLCLVLLLQPAPINHQ